MIMAINKSKKKKEDKTEKFDPSTLSLDSIMEDLWSSIYLNSECIHCNVVFHSNEYDPWLLSQCILFIQMPVRVCMVVKNPVDDNKSIVSQIYYWHVIQKRKMFTLICTYYPSKILIQLILLLWHPNVIVEAHNWRSSKVQKKRAWISTAVRLKLVIKCSNFPCRINHHSRARWRFIHSFIFLFHEIKYQNISSNIYL